MRSGNRSLLLFLSLSLLLTASAVGDTMVERRLLDLEVGPEARRGHRVPLVLDAVMDARSGEAFSPIELGDRLEGVRLLFVGETHTSAESHRVQLAVIRALVEAGREVIVGLEMYPTTAQTHLDDWARDRLTETGFVDLSDWYENWGYAWRYYREIFLYCRDQGVAMVGLNVPRRIVRRVREGGLDGLTEEERALVPPEVTATNEDHTLLFKAHFDDDDPMHSSMSEEDWQGMIEAQSTWDATMAYQAVRALQARDSQNSIVVVLVGSGHVTYGLGLTRQAESWFDGPVRSLVAVPVEDEDGEAIEEVRASYADFVWGVLRESDALYPELGLATRAIEDGEGQSVLFVSEDSVAERAGIEAGDVLLTVEGKVLAERSQLRRALGERNWGDRLGLTLKRGEEVRSLVVELRRGRE